MSGSKKAKLKPKPKRQRVKVGYAFRSPNGELDFRTFSFVGGAQANAAFACERPHSHITTPDDWNRAYRQGFRIVRVRMVAGATKAAWKKYQERPGEDDD